MCMYTVPYRFFFFKVASVTLHLSDRRLTFLFMAYFSWTLFLIISNRSSLFFLLNSSSWKINIQSWSIVKRFKNLQSQDRLTFYLQFWHQIAFCLFLNKVSDPVQLGWGAGGLSSRGGQSCFSFLQQSSCLLPLFLLIVSKPAKRSTYQTQWLALDLHICRTSMNI